jgi:hypothetical protein
MAKLSLNDVTNLTGQETSAIATINNNSSAIETALENTLSRDGTSPNSMNADIDMDENDLMNVGTLTVESIVLDGVALAADDIQAVGPQGDPGPTGPQGPAGTTSPVADTSTSGTVTLSTLAQLLSGTSGVVPTSDILKTFIDMVSPIGEVKAFFLQSAPTYWLPLRGGTIGSTASGATERADDDTLVLFTILWNNVDNADLAIQTSVGVPSVRGVSAAVDFAANKRLPLPDLRDRFLRGQAAAGRNIASYQADAYGSHIHTGTTSTDGNHFHTFGVYNQDAASGVAADGAGVASASAATSTGGSHNHTLNINASGDTETRPKNLAVLYCVRY